MLKTLSFMLHYDSRGRPEDCSGSSWGPYRDQRGCNHFRHIGCHSSCPFVHKVKQKREAGDSEVWISAPAVVVAQVEEALAKTLRNVARQLGSWQATVNGKGTPSGSTPASRYQTSVQK